MKVTGKVWKFPQDDINTDQIRRKNYAYLPAAEQAKHCLEILDPEFSSTVKPGDILVAGKNFGCGSSTPVHPALMTLGISVVLAESFARIFFRHSISGGLLVTPCPGIIGFVSSGDRVEVDTLHGQVRNLATGQVLAFPPLPGFLREMAELGGELGYLMARLGVAE